MSRNGPLAALHRMLREDQFSEELRAGGFETDVLGGEVMVHGAFETHPLTFCRNLVRENPHDCPVDEFLERLDVGAAT